MTERMAYLSEESIVSKIHNQNLHMEDSYYDNVQDFSISIFICDESDSMFR